MKNIKILGLLSLIGFVGVSCNNDDYVEPDFGTASFGIYASFFNHTSGGANTNPTYLSSNTLAAMKDLSQGYTSHEWSFWRDANMGASEEADWVEATSDEVKFIKDNADLGWEAPESYEPYVDSSIKPVNSRASLAFYFENGGPYKAVINNRYKKEITYYEAEYDSILVTMVNKQYKSTEISSGVHEVEREYLFEIYQALEATAGIYYDADCTNGVDFELGEDETKATIEISQNTTLYFKDETGSTTYDMPTARNWFWSYVVAEGEDYPAVAPVVTPTSSTDEVAAFTFDEVGTFNFSLTVSRSDATITHMPSSENTLAIPLNIVVK